MSSIFPKDRFPRERSFFPRERNRFNIPYAGSVEVKVIELLLINRGEYTTKSIAYHVCQAHESTWGALQALHERGFVKKGYCGRECIWQLDPERIPEIIRQWPRLRRYIKTEEIKKDEEEDTVEKVKIIGFSLVKTSLNIVLPLMSPQIYAAYKSVDLIYSSWNLIQNCSESYKVEGYAGVAKTLGSTVTASAIGSGIEKIGGVETNILWAGIKEKIPSEQRPLTRNVLSTVIDKLDEKEIDYVEQYLKQN